MDLSDLTDFAKEASLDIGMYTVDITLSTEKMMREDYELEVLEWNSIKYGRDEIDQVPNDRRGVYAFVVRHPNSVLPPHGYVLYMGIAGRDSERPLRERYKDYLNVRKVAKRERIARMIGTWHETLHFYFAPVDNDFSNDDLKTLEQKLNTALMPAFSRGDLEADTKRKQRALR